MERRLLAAVLTVSILAASQPAAADWPADEFAPVLDVAEASAANFVAFGNALAENSLELAGTIAGPAFGLAGVADALLGSFSGVGEAIEAEFVAAGEGAANTLQQNGTFAGRCEGMRAAVEYHDPYFNENPMLFDLRAGQGSPYVLCTTGWSGAFQPGEVSGSPETGLVGTSRSIDANIDLYLGPARADGTRVLWIRQVTYPGNGNGSIGDVLEFTGTVSEVL